MPKFKTAIFDMDGVVIDSQKLYSRADKEFLGRHGVSYNEEEVPLMLVGKNLKEGTGIMKEKYAMTGGLDELFAERKLLLAELFKTSIEYIKGFKEFHAKLINKGVQTCIATASNDELIKIIDAKLEIFKVFNNKVFSISQVGDKSKPDPAIFLYAAKQMDSEPKDCFVIEDAPRGIEAAKNAGMFCVGIATTFSNDKLSQADVVVNSFKDINLDGLANFYIL